MDRLNVWLIDDCYCDPDDTSPRKNTIELLKRNAQFNFITSSPDDYLGFRGELNSHAENMDLVIIDFKLDKGRQDFSVGSELVSIVRHICNDTPIYLLSAVISSEQEFERIQGFERIIGDTFLSKANLVLAEVQYLKHIKDFVLEQKKEDILTALVCPEAIGDDVLSSLPSRVLEYFNNSSESVVDGFDARSAVSIGPRVEMIRWILDRFYRYPGFLLDDNACAQMLGIKKEYFISHIANQFDASRYQGVLSKTLRSRWWRVLIENQLLQRDVENKIDGTKSFPEAYASLLDVPSGQESKCVVCNLPWPDALARDIHSRTSDVHPVHISCSDFDTSIGPYFSKPRIITEQ